MSQEQYTQKVWYKKAADTMVFFRDLETSRTHQFNGSKRNMTKLNNFVQENWGEGLTAEQIKDFGFTLKNVRYYTEEY